MIDERTNLRDAIADALDDKLTSEHGICLNPDRLEALADEVIDKLGERLDYYMLMGDGEVRP